MGLRRLLLAMPRCVSQHELGHPVCDGAGARLPCPHRDVCVATKCVMIERSVSRESLVVLVEDDNGRQYAKAKDARKLEKRLQRAIRVYGVAEGQTKVTPVPRPAQGERVAPAAKEVARKGARAPRPRPGNAMLLDMWYREWVQIIADMTKLDVARHWSEAEPGDIFIHDRRGRSGYVGLYLATKHDWPGVGLGCLVWRHRMVRMDVKFPLPVGGFEGIGVEAMRWLKPQSCSDGRWKSRSRELDRAGVRLSAEVIAQLVNRGKIRVPES